MELKESFYIFFLEKWNGQTNMMFSFVERCWCLTCLCINLVQERGLCLDRIAENLNSIETVWFKVNQRSLRDRLIKLLKIFKSKRTQEEKASGISPDHTELDDLLQDILERQQQAEIIATEKSDEQ